MTVEVGAQAPEFTLKDQNMQDVSLSDFRGSKNVLLVFYPFAFSSICTDELAQVREDIANYQNEKTQVLAVSTDPVFSLKAYAKAEGYEFPLLSDFWPHGELARTYGVFNDKAGMANRGTFVVDTEGLVRFSEHNGPGERRDQEQWVRALATL